MSKLRRWSWSSNQQIPCSAASSSKEIAGPDSEFVDRGKAKPGPKGPSTHPAGLGTVGAGNHKHTGMERDEKKANGDVSHAYFIQSC